MFTPVGSPVFRRAALVELLALAVAFSGCTPPASAMNLGPPVVLEKADFSTPQSAVKTYIAFTSYAYRLARSDVASRAATPWESVRVDSYIELNRLKDRGIEQQLTSAAPRSVSKESTRTLLAFTEQQHYRYLSLAKRAYTSSVLTATYEATYTVVHERQGWLVDRVEATALTPVR